MFTTWQRILAFGLVGVILGAFAGLATAAMTQGEPPEPVTEVTFCHSPPGSEGTQFQYLIRSPDQILGNNGHVTHPFDIIPPFYYSEGGVTKHFDGLNWNGQGQDIFANGCVVPSPPPQPIQPSVKCVDVSGSTLKVIFGYTNPNTNAVTIQAGSAGNFIDPGGDRGQPSIFNPGTTESAVEVTGPATSTITWTITYGGSTSSQSADASSPTHCTTPPPPTPRIDIHVKCIDNAASSFSATFAYLSSASGVVTIPLGADNSLAPSTFGNPPTEFQSGGEHTFTISGIPNGTTLVWTLTSDETQTAPATADFQTKCTPQPTSKPVTVFPVCIDDNGGTFTARFGYTNENAAAVDIPVGPSNQVTITRSRSAPPTHFEPGTVMNALTVTADAGDVITWSVTYPGPTPSEATATEAFPTKCSVDPPDPPGPYRIGAFVTCVTNQGSTYSATFGYESEDTETATIPIGDDNHFSPGDANRGQPTTFEPGNHPEAVTVNGIAAGTRLTWSITSDQERWAVATSDFPTKCGAPPPDLVPIGLFVTCVTNHANTYDAVFGYTNDNLAEQIVPLGLANTFVPAPGNRGQPTTFEPGTVRNAVTVRGIPNSTQLVWAVFHVKARVAVANQLLPDKCDDQPVPPPPPPPEPIPPPEPPDPVPPPGPTPPPESGLFATCVLRLGAPTFTAIFGYANGGEDDVIIPIGRRNLVAPAPINRGQPSVFRPGVTLVAFTVRNVPRTKDLTWRVSLKNGEVRTATASARYPRNCITAPPAPSADLVVTKSAKPTQVSGGQRVTYTIHVINRGPNIALNVRIVDVLDARLELLSASSTRGSCTTSGQRVSCRVVEFPPGAGVTVTVAARARGGGTIRNVALATHSRRDPTPRNNVDSAVIHVAGVSGAVRPSFTG